MKRHLISAALIVISSLVGCDSRGTQSGNSRQSTPSAPLASMAHAPATPLQSEKPGVVSWPDLERYYPENAARDHIDGIVRITVTLDEEGRATNTYILSERPPNLGFGAAASTVAHLMRYSNPTGHETSVTFNIKFRSPHLSRLQKKFLRLR
jgi:TonB family protein